MIAFIFSWSTWRELTLTCVLTLQASSPTADGRRDGAARAVWVCYRLLQWHRRLHSSMCTEYTHAGTTGVLMLTHFHEQNFAMDTDVTNYSTWNSVMQDIFSCEFIFDHFLTKSSEHNKFKSAVSGYFPSILMQSFVSRIVFILLVSVCNQLVQRTNRERNWYYTKWKVLTKK